MLLTIFNLPAQTRYGDVKSLIHTKCGFKDVILDNLTSDSNNTKKVTVGLAEEEDAAILMRKINGLFLDGQQLFVTTIKKKAASTVMDLGGNQQQPLLQQPMLQQPYYQQSNQPNYEQGYSELQQSRAQAMVVPSMAYGAMYGAAQNASANYGYPQQMQHYQSTPQQLMAQTMLGYDQGAPLGFSKQTNNPSVWSDTNDWNLAGNASAGNQVPQQAKSGSRWENTGDSSSRPRRDAPARDSDRDRPSRFGQDASPRDVARNAPRRDLGRDAASRDRGRDAPREQGRDRAWDASRDQGRDRGWDTSRDQGRGRAWDASRDQGRDRGNDAPRDQERVRVWDASRDQGRDRNQGRERGRDAPARARGREPPARNALLREPPARNALLRDPPARNAPLRDNGRDNRRPEPSRAPTKRQLSPSPSLYGAHATNSAPHMRTFSQQRDGPKVAPPNQPWGKAQPNQKKADTNYVPPSKRPKKQGGVAQQPDKPQANVPATTNQEQPKSKKKKVDTPERRQIRTATWRAQIASLIGKELMSNPKYDSGDTPTEQLLTWLKRSIRNRLDKLFGDDLEIRVPAMLQIYKEKFDPNNDLEFFNQVKEDVNASRDPAHPANIDIEPLGNVPPAPQDKNKPVPVGNIPPAPQAKNTPASQAKKTPAPQAKTPAPQAKKTPVPVADDHVTIPSYPQGDKKGSKILKKANAAIFEDENTLLSQMDATMRQALVDEIDAMGPVLASEFDEIETDAQLKNTIERSKADIIEDYKKMMKVNLAKRMLSIGPIMLRIFTEPKHISKGKLAPILAKQGITSLRKSSKKKDSGYYGTCETYKVFDKLCNMKPITVEGSTVVIKPFQLTGKPEKPKRGKNVAGKDDDEEDDDISDEFDNEIDDDGNNLNNDYDQNNTQDQNEGENGNPETNETEDYQETDLAEDEDTNGNIKMGPNDDQENIDVNDNAENGKLPESEAVKSETETESVVKSDKDENTKETDGEVNETNPEGNLDFVADVDINADKQEKGKDVFKTDEHTDLRAEKDLCEVNAEDLEDSKGNIIDDIDMADLDDDDLEDW